MCDLLKVRFTGPLTQFHAGFAAELTQLGYTPFSARAQLELAAHLSRWMAQADADVADLEPVLVEAFLQARVEAGYRAFRSAKALVPLLEYLRGLGLVAPVVRVCPSTASEVLLERFGVYLATERALVAAVVRGYTDLVRPFVETAVRQGGPTVLTAADVTSFMVCSADRLAPKTVQRLASALRSLLRFWLVDGVMTVSLIEAVPKVAHHPAHLPRGLEPAKVAAMLASCDTTANGRRDRAILLMLSRLGLRAGEVAGLALEDVDWRAGPGRAGDGAGQGQPDRRASAAAGCRPGVGGLSAGRTADGGDLPVGVRSGSGPASPDDQLRDHPGGGRGRSAGRACRDGLCPPAASFGGHEHARRRVADGRDWAGAAAPPTVDHGRLRTGGRRSAARLGPAVAGRDMTGLRPAVANYLRLRRSLGFGLVRDEKLLNQFVDWLAEKGTDTVTVADALAWASLPGGGASWLGFRMQVVRGFAGYLHTLDPAVQVPPRDLLPGVSRRAVPYLYSDADIAALLAQAERLRTPHRTATVQTAIGLLMVTGMRIGEVTGLNDDDFDDQVGLLRIRHPKFDRERLVPLHPTTTAALTGYRSRRDAQFPRPVCQALLVSSVGTRLNTINLGQTFTKLARRAGLGPRPGGCRPRPHDARHAFAVNTLLSWYRDGGDVAARLPLLSTYLGHVDPAGTYWYLSASPELLAEAARRLGDRENGER